MATSEGIPSSIDIEFLELNDNPYTISFSVFVVPRTIVQILHNRQGTFQQSDQQNISGPERHDMDCHRRRTEPL